MTEKKALVIDDEQIVLDSVKRILDEGNYEVETTLSGRQGVAWRLQKFERNAVRSRIVADFCFCYMLRRAGYGR